MKFLSFLTGSLFVLYGVSACQGEITHSDCNEFREDLVSMDTDGALIQVNKWLNGMQPISKEGDPIGHEENLNAFIEIIQFNCSFPVEIGCYACIETLPLQSHVVIYPDSAGIQVRRTLDISTPSDSQMTLRNIHN